jgi:molecular chaperone GrpE
MDEAQAADDLTAGLTATESKLMQTFARHGIVKIEPAPGSVFDPGSQEALLAIDQPEHESGTIARVLQPGYAYHDRLLRPALVIVAR